MIRQRLFRGKSCPEDRSGWARIRTGSVYVFPTRYGLIYAGAVFVMLIGALNYDSNLGLLFCFVFASIGLVTILYTWLNVIGLQVRCKRPVPVFAGDSVRLDVSVKEDSKRARPAIVIEADGRNINAEAQVGMSPARVSLYLGVEKRGIFQVGRLKVTTRFPFGLVQAWAYVESSVSYTVYPRPSPSQNFRTRSTYSRSEKGDKGVGADDFVGPRPYRPGDSPRHIDWKALAREKGLVTRQFGGDREEQIWVEFGKRRLNECEVQLSRMCRMIIDAEAKGTRYGLRLPNCVISPASGDHHKHRCLIELARFEPIQA